MQVTKVKTDIEYFPQYVVSSCMRSVSVIVNKCHISLLFIVLMVNIWYAWQGFAMAKDAATCSHAKRI